MLNFFFLQRLSCLKNATEAADKIEHSNLYYVVQVLIWEKKSLEKTKSMSRNDFFNVFHKDYDFENIRKEFRQIDE